MSNTYIVEPKETGSKKDDTLIIIVNDDGTIAVDQETLQNLIMNQANANVSVVRVGQAEGDEVNGDLTFTVDPPAFENVANPTNVTPGTATDTGLVDPFMEMDPEQLEKLETALQSEQAKQILGENVAAMLDMLTVEEQQNSMKYAIELDHCYTSRTSPSDPEPLDPLPVVNSPEDEEIDVTNSSAYTQTSTLTTPESNRATPSVVKVSAKSKAIGRPRKGAASNIQVVSSTPAVTVVKNFGGSPDAKRTVLKVNEEEPKDDDLSSLSETSESESSDNDSDFGPRGPRRPGVRARGGRRGLTTRGGSMAATRRRVSHKRVDPEQARRLDMEMAAAVESMRSPEKVEKIEKPSPTQSKKQFKVISSRKKDEVPPVHPAPNETPPVIEKPLQTTNQVKANLINANMIKGEMILTKPGQNRNNQKVFFVQKKVVMKPHELTSLGVQKTNIVSMKDFSKVVSQIQTKLGTTSDGKMIIASKPIAQNTTQVIQNDAVVNPVTSTSSPVQKQLPKIVSVTTLPKSPIIKTIDIKKEKKKDVIEPLPKSEDLPKLTNDVKTPDNKKIHKKDLKKSPGILDSLGPALFSTPDIIRRVGSNNEPKALESSTTPVTLMPGDKKIQLQKLGKSSEILPTDFELKGDFSNTEMAPGSSNLVTEPTSSLDHDQIHDQASASTMLNVEDQKLDTKITSNDDIQPPLDPASNTEANEEIARPSEDSVRNIISDQSGIEGEEHLLATLEMEASKHEEELLAEALLLQEQLDVDLSDPAVLGEPPAAIAEPLLSAPNFDTELLQNTNTCTDITAMKFPESQVPKSTPEPTPNVVTPVEQTIKKESKDVIQIVRGGRVITLPPIEAPATRSKRLQAKAEASPKVIETPKRETKFNRQIDEMDSDDEEEENSDSEDDPNRLWCICKRPHNNRFMICCDVCEDWFHGKCVNVSKAMGKQMEEQGVEWVCPNCLKKKQPEVPPLKLGKLIGAKTSKATESAPTAAQNPTDNSGSQHENKPVKSSHDVKQNSTSNVTTTQCVVCKKEARSSSIYCSDACILMHAQETLTKDKPVSQSAPPKAIKANADSNKPSADARVIVFERKTGKVLTGADAPTTENLKSWLKEHPTFEVVRPNDLNTLLIGGKTVTTIQTPAKMNKLHQQSHGGKQKMIYTKVVGSKQTILAPSNKKITVISGLPNSNMMAKDGKVKQIYVSAQKPPVMKQTTLKTTAQNSNKSQAAVKPSSEQKAKKQESKASTSNAKSQQKIIAVKKSEPEPIRLNVRKTLAELLTTRIKETEDLKLNDEEISDLALKIELELYKYFKDTGSKYKAKYRSLVFNIKDTKNLTLFRKIADRSLTPDAVVRLSPDEMASQELAEWREKETKHQLEMIKKNELDLMAQAKSIVVKTHKGEQIIENEGGIGAVDPKTPIQDIVSVLNNADNTMSDILDDKEETSSSVEDLKRKRDDKKHKDKDRKRDKDHHRSRNRESIDSKRDRSSSRRHRSRDRSRDRRRSKDGKRDKERDRDRDRDREKDKDRERSKDKDKEKPKNKEKDRSRRSSKSRSTHSGSKSNSHKEHKDKDKKKIENEDETKKEVDKNKEPSPVHADKPIEDRLWRHVEDETTTNTLDGNDSDVSDREPSSTVNIKTPDINEDTEKEKDSAAEDPVNSNKEITKLASQTVWRGFVNMVDVAKFFINAQEVSGNAKDLMEDLPDTVDVIGRISHETVWDYISKMKKTGSKEILVIRLTAANDEEKIPYITLYSYLNSRSRLGVVNIVSKNIKDFYIMPFSSTSQIPPVLMPISGPGFEEQRPHLLLGIIVRNKRKRLLPHPPIVPPIPPKIPRKDVDRSYTPPLVIAAKEQPSIEKPVVRNVMDSATISKIVPELSSKIDLTSEPEKTTTDKDDDDEPYSPGELDDAEDNITNTNSTNNLLSAPKNSTELQRKMEELNRQIEEQKQQIQSISSSFLNEPAGGTLPGLGLDPPGTASGDSNEAYSPSDSRSFTPPPQGLAKFAQPILDKVSDITIPPNLQEILANVKRQETSKIDPYLPTKPSASFLTSVNSSSYQKSEKMFMPTSGAKESSKSTLRSLSDMDLIKKAEEELAAVAAVASIPPPTSIPPPSIPPPPLPDHLPPPPGKEVSSVFPSSTPIDSPEKHYTKSFTDPMQTSRLSDQPKPPGLEDEDLPTFPSITPPPFNPIPKTGIVLNIKRKNDDTSSSSTATAKNPRTQSRWGQGPSG